MISLWRCDGPVSRPVRSQGNTARRTRMLLFILALIRIRRRDPSVHVTQGHVFLYDIMYFHVTVICSDISKVEYIYSWDEKQVGFNVTAYLPYIFFLSHS